jgi:hypothetical protein
MKRVTFNLLEYKSLKLYQNGQLMMMSHQLVIDNCTPDLQNT